MVSKPKVAVVGAAEVRAWARDNMSTLKSLKVTKTVKGKTVEQPVNLASLTAGPQGTGRGRLAAGGPIVGAYLAANPGHQFGEKVHTEPTVEVPTFNKNGRRTGRTVSIPVSEARALSGQSKGRLSAANIAKAGEARSAANRKA